MIMAKDSNNNYVKIEDIITQQNNFNGISPIKFKSSGENLENYRIYGNTVGGESVGDRTTNLFDENSESIPGYLNDRGAITTVPNYPISTYDYINVLPNTNYSYKAFITANHSENQSKTIRISYYTSSKVFISRYFDIDNGLTKKTIKTPNNCFYVRLSIDDNLRNIMLWGGSSDVSVYEPCGYRVPVMVSNGTDTQIVPIYLPEQIRKVDDEAEYIDFEEQKQHFADGTSVDVTLPALPTLSGTNTLSVETNTKPSKVWGKLSGPRDVLYVKDNLGNILFSKYHEIEGEPPLIYKAKKAGTLIDYRIYGQTVDGASVGDKTANLCEEKYIPGNVLNSSPTQRLKIEHTIPVTAGTTYTLSFVSSDFQLYIDSSPTADYPFSGSSLTYCGNPSGWQDSTCTFTATNNGYIALTIRKKNNAVISADDIDFPVMFQVGAQASAYEPYGYRIPVTLNDLTVIIYLSEPLGKTGNNADYLDFTTQKRYNADGTSGDILLPPLTIFAGTNTFSIGTAVQPSSVYLKGKLKRTIYGWHVNPDISNSSNAVTYLEDAIGMTPASMGSTTFDYGSWENAFFMPKPCMLKSNGKVDYYLDPNDYTKKLNGTASDISNPNYDGNAMMQWPKIWFKYVKGAKEGQGYFYVANYKADGNFHCWCNYDSENNEINHFYTAIYNGTSFANYGSSKTYVINDFAIYDNKLYKCNTDIATAQAFDSAKWNVVSNTAPAINKMRSLSGIRLTNNNGNAKTDTTTEVTRAEANNTTAAKEWYIETFSDRLLINGLLVLMGKSLNTQAVFGRGLDTGGQSAKEAYVTGTLNNKGLFWGVTENGNSGVKVFGMENFWGCCWHRTAGLITDNHAIKLKLTYGTKDGSTVIGYNQTGNGYIDNGTAPYSNGYVQKMSYNKYGFMPAVVTGGSQSTYYADYHYQHAGYTGTMYALFGGYSDYNLHTGAFYLNLNYAPGITYWPIAASLSCKPLL